MSKCSWRVALLTRLSIHIVDLVWLEIKLDPVKTGGPKKKYFEIS